MFRHVIYSPQFARNLRSGGPPVRCCRCGRANRPDDLLCWPAEYGHSARNRCPLGVRSSRL